MVIALFIVIAVTVATYSQSYDLTFAGATAIGLIAGFLALPFLLLWRGRRPP
jgi:hypothetical protein